MIPQLMTAKFSVSMPDFLHATVQRLELSRFLLVNKLSVKCTPDLQYAPEHGHRLLLSEKDAS
jgi:hypothetical protein